MNSIKISTKKNNISISNLFASARKDKILSLHSQKLEAWLISQIMPEDDAFKLYRVESSQIKELFNLTTRNSQKRLDEITDELLSYKLKIWNGLDYEKFNLISFSRYRKGEGWCEISIDPRLTPYLLNLKESGGFTQLELRVVLSFRSYYSYPFYKLLKSKIFKKKNEHRFEIEIDELKSILGCSEKYKKFAEFQRRVLKPIQKEFAEKADIDFEYKQARHFKRKILSLEISIIRKNELPEHLLVVKKIITKNKSKEISQLGKEMMGNIGDWLGNPDEYINSINDKSIIKDALKEFNKSNKLKMKSQASVFRFMANSLVEKQAFLSGNAERNQDEIINKMEKRREKYLELGRDFKEDFEIFIKSKEEEEQQILYEKYSPHPLENFKLNPVGVLDDFLAYMHIY